ncbi:MAG: hypothetical protein H6673_02780 [Anaerolineales bacterium]|nr:hypothetical protein [Anaerolineales bacterium]
MVVRLNAQQDGRDAFQKGQLRGHPALLLFASDGRELWRHEGVVEFDELEAQIQAIMGGS